jgi:hypothetical protein
MSENPIDKQQPGQLEPDEQRVKSRARELEEENPAPVENPEAQARAMLEYSDELQADSSTKDLADGHVERRTSEDATPPPDA